jgi:ABC-type glycerol-3-phosphate transport system permease component
LELAAHLGPIDWLGDQRYAMTSVIVFSLGQCFGTLPRELFEAAETDGTDGTDWTGLPIAVTFTTAPIMVVFFFLQRYFVQGAYGTSGLVQ